MALTEGNESGGMVMPVSPMGGYGNGGYGFGENGWWIILTCAKSSRAKTKNSTVTVTRTMAVTDTPVTAIIMTAAV